MNNKKQELLDAIETKRTEMNSLIIVLGKQPLSSDTIVRVSEELDLLLNQYQKFIAKNENNIGKNGDKNV